MTDLQGLQLRIADFQRHGCAVAAVVVDPPETNARVAARLGLGFPVLSDPGLALVDAFGLRHAGGAHEGQDIARSASVLLDKDGVVRWRHVTDNVRRRPDPAVILAAVDGLAAKAR